MFIFATMKRFAILLVFLAVQLMLSVPAAAQCAMCKATIESSQDDKHVGASINPAIIYLMIVPYILLVLFFRKKIFSFLRELRGLWSR